MAVNLDVVEKTLEDLEKEITCAICQEHYTDPKILPCLHCYCKQCILKLSFKVGKGKPFPCPECRKDTVFPEGGEEELKSAFIINRLKSMYFKHKKALSKKVSCEICTNTEAIAEAFCRQCDKFACKNCVHMHSVMKAAFEGHKCVPIEHLQTIQNEDLIPKHPEPKKCSTHGEQLKIFCFNCNKLICRDCTLKSHRDHNIEFNNVAASDKKKELMEGLKPLREEKEFVSQALTEVAGAESEILVQQKAALDKIESSFEELNKILEMRKNQLLEEVKSVTKETVETLIIQKKKLTIASEEIQSVIDHTEQCVRLCSDDEVMSMHSEVTSRIQTQIRECREQKTNLNVPKKVSIIVEVDCADALQQFCKENTWISNSAAIKSTLNVIFKEIPETMVVNEEIKFEMSIKPDKIVSANNLKCQFLFISTGAKSTAKIEHTSSCRYYISYTPTKRGRYKLEISLYNHPVPGSPFSATAYASPMQLKVPAKIWKDITSPYGITVNSHSEILVVEHNKAITVFSKDGDKIRTIDMKSLLVNTLRSLAVDCEDNIYFNGWSSTQLGKCDRYFNNIFVRDVQPVGGSGHYNIAVVEDEVLVTKHGNKGQIAVYDKDLNFVRHITTLKNLEFLHLCPDSHGNLYASTREGTIQVLNMNGYILRSFSQDQNKVEILTNPWNVNIYGPYVYVADSHLKKTVVFTKEGQYVTTFGHYGPLYVDEDGILYHCDFYNYHICIY